MPCTWPEKKADVHTGQVSVGKYFLVSIRNSMIFVVDNSGLCHYNGRGYAEPTF